MKEKKLETYVAPCVQFYNLEIGGVLCDSGNETSANNPEDFSYGGTL